jgi:hypothetical protein
MSLRRGHSTMRSMVLCAVAEVARPATALASTGLVKMPIKPLLPVAPSSSRNRTLTMKLTSLANGSVHSGSDASHDTKNSQQKSEWQQTKHTG